MHEHENKSHEKTYTIVINTREKFVTSHTITYDEVVVLADFTLSPDIAYTVTYVKGHGNADGKTSGTMSSGDRINVKEGMEFSVTPSDKS